MKVTELSLQVCYQTQPQGRKTEEREVPESITGSLAEAYKKVISIKRKRGGVKAGTIHSDGREDSSLATCGGPLTTSQTPFKPARTFQTAPLA